MQPDRGQPGQSFHPGGFCLWPTHLTTRRDHASPNLPGSATHTLQAERGASCTDVLHGAPNF